MPDFGAAPASTRVRGCTPSRGQSCGACLERFFEPLTGAAAPAWELLRRQTCPKWTCCTNAAACVQACERGAQKSAEAGSPHAIRAGSQPRAPAGPQHERFASCERRGVRGACTRRGHTFRGAGRAREAGGAPRLAEDVGLVSLGPAQPAHPPSLLAPALRALAERLQRGPAAERGQASPRRAREPRARGKRATKGPGRSGRGLGRSTPPPRPATAPRSRPRHRSSPRGGKFAFDSLSTGSLWRPDAHECTKYNTAPGGQQQPFRV